MTLKFKTPTRPSRITPMSHVSCFGFMFHAQIFKLLIGHSPRSLCGRVTILRFALLSYLPQPVSFLTPAPRGLSYRLQSKDQNQKYRYMRMRQRAHSVSTAQNYTHQTLGQLQSGIKNVLRAIHSSIRARDFKKPRAHSGFLWQTGLLPFMARGHLTHFEAANRKLHKGLEPKIPS